MIWSEFCIMHNGNSHISSHISCTCRDTTSSVNHAHRMQGHQMDVASLIASKDYGRLAMVLSITGSINIPLGQV